MGVIEQYKKCRDDHGIELYGLYKAFLTVLCASANTY